LLADLEHGLVWRASTAGGFDSFRWHPFLLGLWPEAAPAQGVCSCSNSSERVLGVSACEQIAA